MKTALIKRGNDEIIIENKRKKSFFLIKLVKRFKTASENKL